MNLEIRGWLFLVLCVTLFAMICLAAALSSVMRPMRWSDRKAH
jgi:hypothetical protein